MIQFDRKKSDMMTVVIPFPSQAVVRANRIIEMSTFKVLENNEQFLAWLGIRAFRFVPVLPYYILWVQAATLASSVVLVYKNWPTIELISNACIVVVGSYQVFGMYFGFILRLDKVEAVHSQLQQIVNKQGDLNSFRWQNRNFF